LIAPTIGRDQCPLEQRDRPVNSGSNAVAHSAAVAFRALTPPEFERITRPHEPGEPARHVAEPFEPVV